MKKIFILSLLSVFLFAGCNKDNDSIRLCTDFIATVVDTENTCLVELDGGVKYYTSLALDRSDKKLELGDRLYFRYFEINYDQQPSGAEGSQAHPYEITNLIYEKMTLYTPVVANEGTDKLPNDQLDYFYAPYLEQTTIKRNYLNLFFSIPSTAEPKLNLVYTGMKQDTLFYTFKAGYTANTTSGRESRFIETIELENLPEKGYIHLTFHSKNYEQRVKGFLSDSTFVLPFELGKNQ